VAERLECAEARELFPELAIGVAAGDERARALGHLSGCPACRGELAGAAEVVDELLLLAPEHEPPPGFESSVLGAGCNFDAAGAVV
jgi:predicted anti-sigma-YlaC factor YlaD